MDKILTFENGSLKINPEVLAELNQVRLIKANADKRYKELTSAILRECKEDYGYAIGYAIKQISEYNVVAKGGTFTLEFDLERFKQENPIEYTQYCKVVENKETYSLVYSKRG